MPLSLTALLHTKVQWLQARNIQSLQTKELQINGILSSSEQNQDNFSNKFIPNLFSSNSINARKITPVILAGIKSNNTFG
jgi:hypothetical protein